jgi:hypothetical protein
VILDVYNEDSRDVFRVAIYGRLKVEALSEEIAEGTRVEVLGRLANIHWRTPGAGNPVRELGIDAQAVTVIEEGTEAGRVRLRASAGYIAEIRRLAEKMGLSEGELRDRYLAGRQVEEVTRRDAPRILQRMAEDLRARDQDLRVRSQLDQLVPEPSEQGKEDDEIERWAKGLLETPVGELEEAVRALPEEPELRQTVLDEALKRESRPRAKTMLQRMLEHQAQA